jgi:hypothetical protein
MHLPRATPIQVVMTEKRPGPIPDPQLDPFRKFAEAK